jgi:hypothetical protein
MAGSWTNKGRYKSLGVWLRNETAPTTFYLALASNDTPPTVDTNLMSDCSEIAAGNGYTAGGVAIARSAVGFDVWTEDDTNDLGLVEIKDAVYTASGGPIPSSGNGARWALLTDDNGVVASREVYAYFDLVSDRTVSDTQSLTIQDATMRNKLS